MTKDKEEGDGRLPVLETRPLTNRLPERVADNLGTFSMVFSSSRSDNLKARAKMNWLERRSGTKQFDYAMDSRADLTVWRRAGLAIVMNASRRTVLALRFPGVSIFRSFSGRKPKS